MIKAEKLPLHSYTLSTEINWDNYHKNTQCNQLQWQLFGHEVNWEQKSSSCTQSINHVWVQYSTIWRKGWPSPKRIQESNRQFPEKSVNSPTDPCRGLATRFHGKLHVPRKLKCISGQIVFSDSPVSSKGYSTRKLLGYSHVLFCTEPETTLYSFSPKVELLSQIGAW